MKWLSKIEAIHPRGRKYEKPSEPRELAPKGKTLKARLDWIAATVHTLMEDFNFKESTNKLLFNVQVHHSSITEAMPLEQKLEKTLEMMKLVPKAAAEIRRLYGAGALPEDVDRKMVHTFLDEAETVEEQREQFEELVKQYQGFKKTMSKLGFKE